MFFHLIYHQSHTSKSLYKIQISLSSLKSQKLFQAKLLRDFLTSVWLFDYLIPIMISSYLLMSLCKAQNILELNCLMKILSWSLDTQIKMEMGLYATENFANYVKKNGEIQTLMRLCRGIQKSSKQNKRNFNKNKNLVMRVVLLILIFKVI